MAAILQDFRHGVRLLKRTPGFTSVAIAVLALGIGANTAVFGLVNVLVLQPRPGRIDQLVGVFSRDRVNLDRYRDFSYPAYLDLRRRDDLFESVMAHTFSTVGLTEGSGDNTRQAFAAIVSANYFSTLGVHLAAGREFSSEDERPGSATHVAIASYAVWRRSGLDPAFLGRTVRANGSDYTIIGVAPRGFGGTMTIISPEWWFPLGSYDAVVNEMFKQRTTGLTDRGNYPLNVAAALRPGVTRAAAEQALDAFGKRLEAEYGVTDKDRTFLVAGLPRTSVSSRPEGGGPMGVVSALLMSTSGLVLVVACLNLANLLLARGAARRKEIAIRQALGSGRRRIVQQLLVEGMMLSAAGAAAGVVIGWWTTGVLSAWLSSVIPLGIVITLEPTSRMIAAAGGFAAFSTLCFALGPAWALSRPTMSAELKGEIGAPRRAARRFGTGSLLVVGQLAVSLALVAAGGLFVRGAVNASAADPGFAVDRHVIVSLDPSMAGFDRPRTSNFYRDAIARVRALPGVEHASLASIVPFGDFQEGRRVRAKPGDDGIDADFNIVGSEYFATMGMKVLRGREFTRAEEEPGARAATVIIDRPMAKRLFADNEPVGQQVLVAGREGEPDTAATIVGVVSESLHDAFDQGFQPHVFTPTGSLFRASMTIHMRTAPGVAEAAVVAMARRELLALDSRVPILGAKTMADHRYRSIDQWIVRAGAAVFGAFGALALLLATIGVYGLKAYDVSRRTREIGIRMALGATTSDVTRLLLGEGARTTVIGLAVGTLLAAGIGKLASGLLYKVSPFDPIVLAVAAATLSMAAMAACYLPARRATAVPPIEALRSE